MLIAFRSLMKRKVFSFINISGLAIGMTACFLIFLYVHFELSYDRFHTKADRIYRLATDVRTPTETIHNGITNLPAPPQIKMDFPEVESFVRLCDFEILVGKGTQHYLEKKMLGADSSFFQVFDFMLLSGDPATALKAPFSVVLSETAARKYFGNEDPMGKALTLTTEDDSAATATVTGIMKDLPENSMIKAEMLLSLSTITQFYSHNNADNWTNHWPATYLLLRPGTNVKALEARLPDFFNRHVRELMEKNKMFYTLTLHPLKEVYLHFGGKQYAGVTGNIQHVYVFSIVAILIILIACFNFINLTTARAAERAREVGVRKVIGAEGRQLIFQFIGESLIVSLVAFLLTLLLAALLLPLFNQLAGKTISHSIFENPYAPGLLLLGAIGTGLLAGLYPAVVLSSFKPVTVLKGRFVTSHKGIFLRKGLVVTQFAISLALMAATVIIYRQVAYMRNYQLGFRKDQMVVIPTYSDKTQLMLKQVVERLPGVKGCSLSSSYPGSGNPNAYTVLENSHGEFQQANMALYFVDFNYISLYEMKMVAGRSFSTAYATDSSQAMIINEAAAKILGYSKPEDAIGRRYSQWGSKGRIIGVMKNFHMRSLQETIQPLTMRIDPRSWGALSVSISAQHTPAVIAGLEKEWRKLVPDKPFKYDFLDASFNTQYRSEEQFGNLFLYFSMLAIFISCLGLLGLAAYSTVQRSKEIGIRKVMGASVLNIVTLLSGDFIKLVLLAAVIAIPVIWYSMQQWLNSFAYRATLSWWVFPVVGMAAVAIALLTISWQAIRAALMDPVQSLKSE